MESILHKDINDEIPIFVEKCEEDAVSFIERSFNKMKEQEKLKKQDGIIPEDIKLFIDNTLRSLVSTKSKRENYYEHELIKSYKDRIHFLEEEIKLKNNLINNLLDSKFPDVSQYTVKTKTDNFLIRKNKNQNGELSFEPDVMDIETPDVSVTDGETSVREDIPSFEKQLAQVRKKKHDNYLSTKKVNEKENCAKKNVLMIGDSMLKGLNEIPLTHKSISTQIKHFSGAKIKDINKRLDDLLIQKPDIIVLHIGTNDAPNMVSNEIVDGLLALKHTVENLLPESHVVISSLITRIDDGKANLTINKVNKHLKELKIDLLDNSNITYRDLGKKGLHLSKHGKDKYVKNVVKKIKNLA